MIVDRLAAGIDYCACAAPADAMAFRYPVKGALQGNSPSTLLQSLLQHSFNTPSDTSSIPSSILSFNPFFHTPSTLLLSPCYSLTAASSRGRVLRGVPAPARAGRRARRV